MAFQGMDVQQVRNAASDTESQAAELEKLISSLDSECQKVDWRGEDADKFKTQDWPGCKDQATQLVKTLREIAATLEDNAQAQAQVTQAY